MKVLYSFILSKLSLIFFNCSINSLIIFFLSSILFLQSYLNLSSIDLKKLEKSSKFRFFKFFFISKLSFLKSSIVITLWISWYSPFKEHLWQTNWWQSLQNISHSFSGWTLQIILGFGSFSIKWWSLKYSLWNKFLQSSQIHFLHSIQYPSPIFLWTVHKFFCIFPLNSKVSFIIGSICSIEVSTDPILHIGHWIEKYFFSGFNNSKSFSNKILDIHTPHNMCWHDIWR